MVEVRRQLCTFPAIWLMTLLPLASPRHLVSGRAWMRESLVQGDTMSSGKLGHGGEPCCSLLWKRKNHNFHSSIIILLKAKTAILILDNLWWLKRCNGTWKAATTTISYFSRDFLFRKEYLNVCQTASLKQHLVFPKNL